MEKSPLLFELGAFWFDKKNRMMHFAPSGQRLKN